LYYEGLKEWATINNVRLPLIPKYATNNGHIFYLVCNTSEIRRQIISKLKRNNILSVFHYLSLHSSKFYLKHYNSFELKKADFYSDKLLRLPFYFNLTSDEISKITKLISETNYVV
jgi:dTDP-4-amino-4,6-dideoxygalactose transaminase